MLRRTVFAIVAPALLAAVAARAGAQYPTSVRTSSPGAWSTLSIGYLQMGGVHEGGSNTDWDLGGAPAYRATLEMGIKSGAAIGAAVGYAKIPMTFYGADCAQCDADVTMWQAMGNFRIGEGRGLHQVIDINAGVSSFQDVKERRTGTKLGPGSPVIVPTVSIGYGIGYTLSPNSQFILLQEYGLMFFKKGDAPAGSNGNTPRTQVTRIGLRLGFGGGNGSRR